MLLAKVEAINDAFLVWRSANPSITLARLVHISIEYRLIVLIVSKSPADRGKPSLLVSFPPITIA